MQRPRKCLYVYQYWRDPRLGWLNARIQTWFPFSIQICMNGREWLACQMDRAGLGYRKQDNCFPWVADWEQAQPLMDRQLQTKWPKLLDEIAGHLNPIHDEIFRASLCGITGRLIRASGQPISCFGDPTI